LRVVLRRLCDTLCNIMWFLPVDILIPPFIPSGPMPKSFLNTVPSTRAWRATTYPVSVRPARCAQHECENQTNVVRHDHWKTFRPPIRGQAFYQTVLLPSFFDTLRFELLGARYAPPELWRAAVPRKSRTNSSFLLSCSSLSPSDFSLLTTIRVTIDGIPRRLRQLGSHSTAIP